MSVQTKRSTVYIETALHSAIRLKSAVTNRSMSDIVNDSIRAALSEDEADLAAFEERSGEANISYEEFLSKLKADGKI